jgi:hypothetical protein
MSEELNTVLSNQSLSIWLPCVVSVVTLLVNLFFYIVVQPRLSFRNKRKEDFSKIVDEFLVLISEIPGKQSFEGVPTQVRNFSLKIHLCFKKGVASQAISDQLEIIFRDTRDRKALTDDDRIQEWNVKFRNDARNLRKVLARYTGTFHF